MTDLSAIIFIKMRSTRVRFPPGNETQVCAVGVLAHQVLCLCLGLLETDKGTAAVTYVTIPVCGFLRPPMILPMSLVDLS